MPPCVQYPTVGCVVEFFDASTTQIGIVLEEVSGKLRVLLPNRRETKLPASRALPWNSPPVHGFSSLSREDMIRLLDETRKRREEKAASLNVTELWELAQGEVDVAPAQWFAELVESDPDVDTIAAYGHALLAARTHFRFVPPNFEIYDAEKVARKAEELRKQQEREQVVAVGAPFVRLLWNVACHRAVLPPEEEWPAPEMAQKLEELLRAHMEDPETQSQEALWHMLIKGLNEDNLLAVQLLLAWGKLPAHYNFWYDRAGYARGDSWWCKEEEAARLENEAKTVVWLADQEHALGIVAIADRLKETSRAAIEELGRMGITTYMLTGDNEPTARAMAGKAGIQAFRANLLPHEKAAFVRELQAEGKHVAMVGDGINDSAALAQADLSIAMGTGSDIAIDVAQMTIISADLAKIPAAIRLSALTVRTIRQNLFWAFIYNMIGVPIAAGVLYPVCGFLLNPMIAGAAMAMSSVSVVTNSLRLRSKPIHTQIHKPIINNKQMKKTYKVEGMMCNHCRMRVEKALNNIEGVQATVTLDPPVATIEFTGDVKPLAELQAVLSDDGYTISED